MMTRWRPQRLGHSWWKVLSSNHNDIFCTASSLSSLISPLFSPLLSDTSHLIFHLISHLSLSSSSPRDATVIGEECVARHLWRVQRCRLSMQLMFSENRVHTTCLPEMSCSLLSECHWRPLGVPGWAHTSCCFPAIKLRGHENISQSQKKVVLLGKAAFLTFKQTPNPSITALPTKQLKAKRRDCLSKTQLVGSHCSVCRTRAGTRAKTANAKTHASVLDS